MPNVHPWRVKEVRDFQKQNLQKSQLGDLQRGLDGPCSLTASAQPDCKSSVIGCHWSFSLGAFPGRTLSRIISPYSCLSVVFLRTQSM